MIVSAEISRKSTAHFMATISCHHAKAALRGVISQGLDEKPLLIQAGINPEVLALANARIHEDQMTKLIQLIWQQLDDEFMGFTKNRCKTGVFALMMHAIRRCENLREALELGTRYYNLQTDDIATHFEEHDDTATITIVFQQPELDPDYFYLEFWMIIWHRLASWLTTTRIPLLKTAFSFPAPAHALEYNYMFPSQHCYQASSNQLTFRRDFLNLPIKRSKQEVKDFLSHSPYDLLTIPGYDESVKRKIIQIIADSSDKKLNFPPIAQIAATLNMSQQTLHRRLKQEGTGYQNIKENARRDMALTKLVKEKRSVQEVSEIVGFSEASSFTRAFKQWTGLSPREYCKYI